MWTCPRCGAVGRPSDARVHHERGDRDQPAYDEDACRRCAPNSVDLAEARDYADEQQLSELREGV